MEFLSKLQRKEKRQNTYNKEFYKTVASDFQNYGYFEKQQRQNILLLRKTVAKFKILRSLEKNVKYATNLDVD